MLEELILHLRELREQHTRRKNEFMKFGPNPCGEIPLHAFGPSWISTFLTGRHRSSQPNVQNLPLPGTPPPRSLKDMMAAVNALIKPGDTLVVGNSKVRVASIVSIVHDEIRVELDVETQPTPELVKLETDLFKAMSNLVIPHEMIRHRAGYSIGGTVNPQLFKPQKKPEKPFKPPMPQPRQFRSQVQSRNNQARRR